MMKVDQAKRLKELESENNRQKKLAADLSLYKTKLKRNNTCFQLLRKNKNIYFNSNKSVM
jgi:hypothetical protein